MDLYGLIHARFIISSRGLQMMRAKYLNGVFGACPRVLCDRQLVLPVGMSEDLSISRVKVYCPKCEEVYVPRIKFVDIDGAYFGCSFPHIFFQVEIKKLNNLKIFFRLFLNFYQRLEKGINMSRKFMDLEYLSNVFLKNIPQISFEN